MKQNVIQVDPAKVKVPDFQRGKVSKLYDHTTIYDVRRRMEALNSNE